MAEAFFKTFDPLFEYHFDGPLLVKYAGTVPEIPKEMDSIREILQDTEEKSLISFTGLVSFIGKGTNGSFGSGSVLVAISSRS